jgi:predicted aspartyl protease/tetratricopeptide (TPR) repeat protein
MTTGGDWALGSHPATRTRRARHGLFAAAVLAMIGLQAPDAALAAGCKIQRMDLPITMVGRRAVATVRINGTEVPLMVDSGAFFSFLTPAAAEQLHLDTHSLPSGMSVHGLAGKVEARATTVDRLGVLGGEIPNVDFVVGGNEDASGTMGLLGRNILTLTDVEYDLAHGMIRLVVPNDDCDKAVMAYWAGDQPVAELALLHGFREKRPAIRAEIKVNDKTITALFDTGAQTLLSLSGAHRVGIQDADMTPNGQAWGAGAGKVASWTARVDKVDFGGEVVRNNQLEVDDFRMDDSDMLLGADFFLSHRVYVSKKQSKMYFTYNGGPVFARNVGHQADIAAADQAASASQDLGADALARRGEASLSRGDLAGALADLDRACAMAPTDARYVWARAKVHYAMRDAAKARADLDAALQLAPTLAEARIVRAGLHAAAGEREAALADLATLDQALPPQSDLRRRMAQLYNDMHLPAQELVQWNHWLPSHQHDIARDAAFNGRCWSRVELGIELDKALRDCDEAVDLDEKNASFRDSRGWTYLRMGKPQKAIDDFDHALALDPKFASSLYGRGQAQLALGRDDRAQADFAAARKERPQIDTDAKRQGLPVAPLPPAAAASAASS